MVSVDEAARMARDRPEVTGGERHGNRRWSVANKAFAWERPFSKADIRRFGDAGPPGPILAVRVADLGEKEAVFAAPQGLLHLPHFDEYPAVLIQLNAVTSGPCGTRFSTAGWPAPRPARGKVPEPVAVGRR